MQSPEEYYKEQFDTEHKLMLESFQSRVSFAHHLTLVSATLLGILVAFHPSPSEPRLHLWVFFLAVVSLSISILLLLYASNAYTSSMRELHQRFRSELERSIQTCVPMENIQVKSSTNSLKLVSYAFKILFLSIILIVSYAGVAIFN